MIGVEITSISWTAHCQFSWYRNPPYIYCLVRLKQTFYLLLNMQLFIWNLYHGLQLRFTKSLHCICSKNNTNKSEKARKLETPLAAMLPSKYANVEVTELFPDFRPDKVSTTTNFSHLSSLLYYLLVGTRALSRTMGKRTVLYVCIDTRAHRRSAVLSRSARCHSGDTPQTPPARYRAWR